MKSRILFALVFVLFLALGILSLGDMQTEAARLPAQSRLTAYIAAVPLADAPAAPAPLQAADKTVPCTPHLLLPAPCALRADAAPQLDQSYYLAKLSA